MENLETGRHTGTGCFQIGSISGLGNLGNLLSSVFAASGFVQARPLFYVCLHSVVCISLVNDRTVNNHLLGQPARRNLSTLDARTSDVSRESNYSVDMTAR